MRRVLAWFLLLGGLLTGLAGAAVLTVLAPPATISAAVTGDGTTGQDAVATTTAPGVLDLSGPVADLTATATPGTEVFLATARADDLAAWVQGAATTEVTGVAGDLDDARLVTGRQGTGPAVDPRTADIWLTSVTGDGTARLVWSTDQDEGLAGAGGVVAFAATDGTSAAPQEFSIRWANEGASAEHPSGIPLVVVGCVLVVLGAVGVLVEGRRS